MIVKIKCGFNVPAPAERFKFVFIPRFITIKGSVNIDDAHKIFSYDVEQFRTPVSIKAIHYFKTFYIYRLEY